MAVIAVRLFVCVVVLVLVLAGRTVAFAASLNEERFTQYSKERILEKLPGWTVTVHGPLLLTARSSDGRELEMSLGNAYAEYARNPEAVDAILDRFVAAYPDVLTAGPAADPQQIVPLVRDRAWVASYREHLRQRGAKDEDVLITEPLNDELVVVFAEDTPRAIRFLKTALLAKSGLERSDLRAKAIGNLRRLLPPAKLHSGPQISALDVGGMYETSLLLLDQIWSAEAMQVKGEVVVAVPARGYLFFTGTGDPAAVATLRAVAARVAMEAPYPMTRSLFVRRNGRLETLE